MVAAMVMETLAILMATGTETVVTGIVVTVVRDVTIVIGGEIKEQGESLSLIEAFPLQWRHAQPDNSNVSVPPPLQISALRSSRKAGFAQAGKVPCRERIYSYCADII